MSARMALHVALSLRLDAIEAHRLAKEYRDEVLREAATCPCTTPSEYTPEYHCVCRDDPATGPAHEGHETWCPARKPTPERITEIRQGIGDELTSDELAWLSGAAGRHELHIAGARAGEWPMRDLPGAVLRLSQYLAATVSVIERQRSGDAEEKTTTASTTAGAAVTPQPDTWQSEDEQRRNLLLAEIRTHGGKWTTRRVIKFYRDGGADGPLKARAKRDLHTLYVLGVLSLNGPQDGRFYLLRKGAPGGHRA